MNDNQGKELKKRHCMVVHSYYPEGETRVERQALALVEHGIEVDVVCLQFPDQARFETVAGVQVHRLPVRRFKRSSLAVQLLEYVAFFLFAFISVTRLYRKRGYSVVQVHNLPDFLVFTALYPKLRGAKVILDLHDLMPEFYAERLERPMEHWSVRLIRWQERLSCRFADHVITVTELWRQALVERGQPPEKVTVVMNVPHDQFFHQDVPPMPNNGSERAGTESSDNNCLRLIYHGAMAYRHGLDLALRAIGLARQMGCEIVLTLQGGAPHHHESLKKTVEELGLQQHVQFNHELVPTHELPQLLRQADLAVVPYRDGVFTGGILPTKLMEYAALGIPAIVARTPAISSYFDETCVAFFTPGDVNELAGCIKDLYYDRARLANLAKNISRFSEQNSWRSQRTAYLQLISRLQEARG